MVFPTTLWSSIRDASSDPEAAERFARRYRPAVLSFVLQRGYGDAAAEDLTHEVFLRIFAEDILSRADASRGRFRSLLVAVTKQVLADEARRDGALKRGGGARRVDLAEAEAAMAGRVEEEEFDRCWAANLLSLAFRRLEQEGGPPYARALRRHIEGGAYEEIAGELGTSLTNVSTWIRRARLRLKSLVQDEIHAYSSSQEEYKDETQYLGRFLVGSE
ncbi:MAG: sigma-70 family RNA polymerase sigma factor [Planctomycetes bacterium]|nr:sigma-70 family RNA polymerase sigma factor [Planctomycetota bacterium]